MDGGGAGRPCAPGLLFISDRPELHILSPKNSSCFVRGRPLGNQIVSPTSSRRGCSRGTVPRAGPACVWAAGGLLTLPACPGLGLTAQGPRRGHISAGPSETRTCALASSAAPCDCSSRSLQSQRPPDSDPLHSQRKHFYVTAPGTHRGRATRKSATASRWGRLRMAPGPVLMKRELSPCLPLRSPFSWLPVVI